MLQDLANQYALIDKADDLHHATAVRAFEGINFPGFLDAFAPGSITRLRLAQWQSLLSSLRLYLK